MAAAVKPFDNILFGALVALTVGGFLIFISAALGLLTRDGAGFMDVAFSQFVFGIVGGSIALLITSHIPYQLYRKYSIFLFAAAFVVTMLVFVPGIGLELKGASRWLDLGFVTVQPAEALKLGYVLYLATWLSRRKLKVSSFMDALIPFSIITGLAAGLILLQPDTGTTLVLLSAGGAMFLAAGARVKDILILIVAGAIILGSIALMRPYVIDRITTFLDPSKDPLGSSYQVQQSLIAIGSGGLTGRGFGQSVQKFSYLPEPIGDSIFAVYAEEAGFIGALLLITAFITFALRGLWVAARAPDLYGGLVAVGIVILIIGQTFLNMASMLGVFPLTGVPLMFVSHGGTALAMGLAGAGVLLNISRARRIG